MKKILLLIASFFTLIHISSCVGYKPIFSTTNFNFEIAKHTIDGDKILGLLTKELIKKNNLNKKTVVSTVMSNLGFENYLNEILDVKLIRTAVGDINVIKEMQDNLYSLGGEQSGHIIIGEYSKTGDGILVALKILEILYKSKLKTSELFNVYNSYPQKKINLPLSKKPNIKMHANIQNLYENFQKKNSHLRSIVRESGTESLLRLLVEGKDEKEVIKAINNLSNNIKEIINV